MNKEIAQALKNKVDEVARLYSLKERSKNFNQETFTLKEIIPLSESTAVVMYLKNTGKLAAFFFYYINGQEGYWQYYVPTDSHILGMQRFLQFKEKVEEHNFRFNFPIEIKI